MQPRISGLGHVGVFVEDVDRSLAFYRDLLGLTLTDADEANGMYFLSSRPDEEHHEFLVCRGRTDLTRPVDELMAEIKACVAQYGETGFVDPVLLRN